MEEISELLGVVSGSISTPKNSNLVTLAKLQQLEESYTTDIASLREEMEGEKVERKENEKRLTKCIEKLMAEMLKLGKMITSAEERIEAIEKSIRPTSTTTTPRQIRNETPVSEVNDCGVGKESQRVLRIKVEDCRNSLHSNASFCSEADAPSVAGNEGNRPTSTSVNEHISAPEKRSSTPSAAPRQLPMPTLFSDPHSGIAGGKTDKRILRIKLVDCKKYPHILCSETAPSAETTGKVPQSPSSVAGNQRNDIEEPPFKICTVASNFFAEQSIISSKKVLPFRRSTYRPAPINSNNATIPGVSGSSNVIQPSATRVVHKKVPLPGRFLYFFCVCGLEFDSEKSLAEHLTEEGTTKGKSTRLVKTISRNGERHGKDPSRPLTCICGRKWPTNYSLSRHVRYHTGRRPFVCRSCDRRFIYASALRSHEQNNLKRSVCRRQTAVTQYDAGGNRQTSGMEVQVSRSIDSQKGIQGAIKDNRSSLKKQKIMSKSKRHAQNPIRPNNCICGAQCGNSLALYHHIRCYTTIKNQPFSRKKRVLKRIPITRIQENSKDQHILEKQDVDDKGNLQFVCKCGKRFKSMVYFRRHIRLHRMEKKFTCKLCSKLFQFRAYLKQHMKKCHGMTYSSKESKGLACSRCTKMCSSYKQLYAHRKAAHKEEFKL